MKADLHVHSTASDGSLSPSELVRLAIAADISHLALTDHDSVGGVREAIEASKGTDLKVIPAVELSCVTPNGDDVHILGLFIDPDDPSLLSALLELRAARDQRAQAIITRLNEGGYALPLDAVLEIASGGAVGRSHIARALVAAGMAPSVMHVFQQLLGRGRPFYVPKDAQSPQNAVEMIRATGGLPFVAHPGVSGLDEVVRELAKCGLAGIEAYHADHTPAQRQYFAHMAEGLDLLTSGGSDFHAHDARNPPLGSVDIPESALHELLSSARSPS